MESEKYYSAFLELSNRRLPGGGFGGVTRIQDAQVSAWLDRKRITSYGERETYYEIIFAMDDAYCAYIEHKQEVDAKAAKGEKLTEADVKFEFVTVEEGVA